MKVLHGYKNISDKLRDPVVAIGIFDGIHLGHKRVIKSVVNLKSERDKVVLTFDPHPITILGPKKTPPRIMSIEHRIHIFEKMGLDAVVVINFTEHISAMTPRDFIKKILIGIGTKTVYVGKNFHFGKGRSGDTETFKRLGEEFGIDVRIAQPVKKNGRIVSSTWLRELIRTGNIGMAEKLLRRPVSVLGTVVSGDKRGKTLGVPTANIDPHQEVLPPPGVYAVKVELEGRLMDGVLNIGFKPTFYGGRLKKRKEPHIEVHVLSFDGDLYGKVMEIFFIKRLRKEKRFRNEEQLKRAISKDTEKALKLLDSKSILLKIRKYKYI